VLVSADEGQAATDVIRAPLLVGEQARVRKPLSGRYVIPQFSGTAKTS
jgi:hypothetical protein